MYDDVPCTVEFQEYKKLLLVLTFYFLVLALRFWFSESSYQEVQC